MSQLSPLGRPAVAGCGMMIVFLLSSGLAANQKKGFFGLGGDKNTTYQAFKDPAGHFELEYPTKDWKLLPLSGGGTSLAVFSHKDGPALFVDRVRLDDMPTQGEIGALPEVEIARLRQQQPKVQDFKSDMADSKAGRGVLIQYARVGTQPESVMQFSILVGQDLYRLNGVVPEKLLSKYESIVKHMIESFTAQTDRPTPKS